MHQSVLDLATGNTVSSDTNRPASVTGLAGTRPPLNSSVSAVCSTMKRNTLAIGLKLLKGARNIVSWFLLFDEYPIINDLSIDVFIANSSVQGRRQWQCPPGQILQSLLGLPRWLPTSSTLSGNFSLWQAFSPLCQSTNWGLRGSSSTTSRGPGSWCTCRSSGRWRGRAGRCSSSSPIHQGIRYSLFKTNTHNVPSSSFIHVTTLIPSLSCTSRIFKYFFLIGTTLEL